MGCVRLLSKSHAQARTCALSIGQVIQLYGASLARHKDNIYVVRAAKPYQCTNYGGTSLAARSVCRLIQQLDNLSASALEPLLRMRMENGPLYERRRRIMKRQGMRKFCIAR